MAKNLKTQPKSRTRAADVAVPQTADEAAAFIGRIGIAERMVARIEHDMNDQIAKIKQASEEAASGYVAESKALTEGLRIYLRRASRRTDRRRQGEVPQFRHRQG